MLLKLLIIFFGGLVIDILITKYTRCIAKDRAVSSSLLGGIITLGNLLFWGMIIREAETLGAIGAVVMAFGAGVGTYLGMKFFRS